MTKISIAIYDKKNQLKRGRQTKNSELKPMRAVADNFVTLAAQDCRYADGDKIIISLDCSEQFLWVKLDETLDTSLIYIKDTEWIYHVHLSENAKEAAPEGRFGGNSHYLSVRLASKEEIQAYRNVALNPHDQKEQLGAYPHAHANVETRDDATFFACNAIDGIFANTSHGNYPYESWGINQQLDAALTIDFGHKVRIDQCALTLRADFPHDSYWQQVTLAFSDGSQEILRTVKSSQPQRFSFPPRRVNWVKLHELIQNDDPSPFPALTQIEVFGQSIQEGKL
jgi:hypothetical protein